jgi:hypothetical protein
MNCFFHPEVASVVTCPDCGKALCKPCASKYEEPICDNCNEKRNKNDKKLIFRKYVPSIIMFIVGFILGFKYLGTEATDFGAKIVLGLFLGWIVGGFIWGWFVTRTWFSTSTKIGFGMGVWDIIVLWFKLMCAAFVGPIALPFGIVRLIRDVKRSKQIEDTINVNKGEYNQKTDQ